MFITDLIRQHIAHHCTHEKITPDMEQGYCPDCGELIQNEWYITRCSCCGVKMKAMTRGGTVVPQNNYCVNCGSKNFTVEKLDKINFIDINFAVLVKKIIKENIKTSTVQCWQECTSEPPKLILKC